MPKASKKLSKIYNILYKTYGPRNWWPADSDFEVIVGAILTQNTSWKNVEKAIANLKENNKLSAKELYRINVKKLSRLIKSCGYHNIKAKRLKNFVDYLFRMYQGSLRKFFKKSTKQLRRELLALNGIGPETADSILLYAAHRPVFVVDAYTKRIFTRLGLLRADSSYEHVQEFFHSNLPKNVRMFNEYHALIVEHAKSICRSIPACFGCAFNRECKRHRIK